MRKFIVNISIFSALIIVLAFATDVLFSKQLHTSRRNDNGTWNALLDGKINADIAIYGSSRALVQINPKIIEDSTGMSTYNLGAYGYDFWMMYCRHKLLLKYDKHPRVIILSVDYNTLIKRGNLKMARNHFMPYIQQQDVHDLVATYDNGFNWGDYHLPLVRFVSQNTINEECLGAILRPQHTSIANRNKGYAPADSGWSENRLNIMLSQPSVDYVMDSASIYLFKYFLAETRREGIKVVLVFPPFYYKWREKVNTENEILSFYHSAATAYNIPFFDYSKDSIGRNEKYYYDVSHLNPTGADIFTRKLYSDLKPFFSNL